MRLFHTIAEKKCYIIRMCKCILSHIHSLHIYFFTLLAKKKCYIIRMCKCILSHIHSLHIYISLRSHCRPEPSKSAILVIAWCYFKVYDLYQGFSDV